MARRKAKEKLSVMEAVDHLSALAEMDVDHMLTGEFSLDDAADKQGVSQWISPSNPERNGQIVNETFKVIHQYLKFLYDKEGEHLAERDTRSGIQTIMVLAEEAASKVQKCNRLFQGVHSHDPQASLKEYKGLSNFYLSKIKEKFQAALEKETDSSIKLEGEEELDLHKKGLKDLETIRRDQKYEMFWIKNEEGRPIFNRAMLRHIKLVSDFEELTADPEGDDPFLKLTILEDRHLNDVAKEIKESCMPLMQHFYKDAFSYKEEPLVRNVHYCLMALMLSTHNRNLIQNTEGKTCQSYFKDFVRYLRAAITCPEYQQIISSTKEHPYYEGVVNLLHKLSYNLYTAGGGQEEFVEFIYRLIHKGEEHFSPHQESNALLSLWNTLLDNDAALRQVLSHYPNGPLLKTLDLFGSEEIEYGFDPLIQGNYPGSLFSFELGESHITLLRVPSPTMQEFIYKAEVVPEFKAFLRAQGLSGIEKGVHLLVNLQDRTAFGEHARCVVLEQQQKEAEFLGKLVTLTMDKNTDFYRQADTFAEIDDAETFKEQFLLQVLGKEECGFSFPFDVEKGKWNLFIKQCIQMVHTAFFEDKETLSKKARMDFIEIFYMYFIMKVVEEYKPISLSFTCKDAVDTGAAQNGMFYSFLQLLSANMNWSEQEKNELLRLFYLPALSIRDRALDSHRFHRVVSALSVISGAAHKDFTSFMKATAQLLNLGKHTKIRIAQAD